MARKAAYKHLKKHGHIGVFLSLAVLMITLGYVGSAMSTVTGAFLGVPPAGTDVTSIAAMFVLSLAFLIPMELMIRKQKG